MNKKKILIFVIAIVVVILSVGATYAWYVWSTPDESITQIATKVGYATVKFDGGPNFVDQTLEPVSDKTLGLIKGVSTYLEEEINGTVTFNLYLDILSLDEGLKDATFKYEFYDGSVLLKNGNFTQEHLDSNLEPCETNSTNHIVLIEGAEITTKVNNYLLYIWIDGNEDNSADMYGAKFDFKLHADGTGALIEEAEYPDISTIKDGSLADDIVSTYLNAEKTPVISNNIRYRLDTTDLLMADVAGNVRYYDGGPNNYIYFNCDDYSNQSADTCELWRIIGVFQDKVKLVRNNPLGTYSYNNTNFGSWVSSTLKALLNGAYYNNEDTTYNNTGTIVEANFKTDGIGIKDNTRGMIATVLWNLGGHNTGSVYADEIYKYERGTVVYTGNPTIWTGNIGMLYASDLGYSIDLATCGMYDIDLITRAGSDGKRCALNHTWVVSMFHIVGGQTFFLNSLSNSEYGLVYHNSHNDSRVSFDTSHQKIWTKYVYPTLFLNSEIAVMDGNTGSSDDPYRIVVSS